MTIQEIRALFPALDRKVYGRPLVYLDNAATSERPTTVLDKFLTISEKRNANLHRAVHRVAVEATEEYENTRGAVGRFMNAAEPAGIVFTSGATMAINLVAFSFGEAFVGPGDEILVSESGHHSNIVPWQMLCQRKGAELRVLPVSDDGYLEPETLDGLITPRTRLVAVEHVSNVLGIVNPIKELAAVCHSHGVPILVDGAQGIVHCGVDVQKDDVDFYAFSGHKIYAAPGTGVLYGKRKYLEAMPPYMGGGEMIETVSFKGTTYAPVPGKFEAGTQNIAGTPTLKPALVFAAETMETSEIEKIKEFLPKALSEITGLRLYGVPRRTEDKVPLYSFTVEGAHHEDLALLLDKMGVAVRSGQMCAEPLMDRFGVTGMVRASFAPYNTLEEAGYFVESLKKAIKMLS